MAVVQRNIGSKREFKSDSIIAFGEVNKDTFKATLKMADGKLFNLPETNKADLQKYTEIFVAFNDWVITELP